jgi:glycosyltransferase involved in cell wall biosynthesis
VELLKALRQSTGYDKSSEPEWGPKRGLGQVTTRRKRQGRGFVRTVTIVQDYVPAYRVPFFEQLKDRLSTDGLKLRVIYGAPDRRQSLRGDSAEVAFAEPLRRFDVSVGNKRYSIRDLRSAIRDTDLLILEQARRQLDTHILLGLPRRQLKVALWGHGIDHAKVPTEYERSLMKRLTRKADWFFAYTERSARAVSVYGFPPNHITVVNNSLDTSQIRRQGEGLTEVELESFRQRLKYPNGPIVLFIGALIPEKRIDHLVGIFSEASQTVPNLNLVIAGRGPEEERINQAKRDGLAITTVGHADAALKALLGRVATCLLVPDQVGLVAVDSFAMRSPIVSTAHGRHGPEHAYLEADSNALLTSPDLVSLAAGVVRLCLDSRLQNRLLIGCDASYRTYRLDGMVSRFTSGIRDALAVI